MANAVELLDRQTSQSLNDSMATYYTTKQNIVFVAQELVENLAYLANTDVQTRKTNIIRNSLFRNRSKINTTVPPVSPQPVVESPKAAEIKSNTEDLMNLFNDAPATAAGTVVEPVHTPAPPPPTVEVIPPEPAFVPPPPMAEPVYTPPPPVIEAKPPEPVYTPPAAPSAIGGFDELDSFFAEPAAASAAVAAQPPSPPPVAAIPIVEEVVPPPPAAAQSSTDDLLNLFDEFAPSAPPKAAEPVYAPPPPVAEPVYTPPVVEMRPPEPEPVYAPPPPVAKPVYTPPVVEMRPPEPEPVYAPPPPVAEPVYTPPVVEMRPPEPEPVYAPPPPVTEPVYTPPIVEMRPPDEPVFASQVSYETTPEAPAQDLDELRHKLSTTNSSVMISPSIKNNFSAILMEIESNLSNMKSYTVNKEALISLYDKLKHNQNMSMQEIVDLSRQIVEANKFVEEYQTKAKDELDSMENVAELFKEMADALVYNIRKAKNDFNRDS